MRHELERLEQADYKEKLQGKAKPQMIFFTAEWSEPCRQMQGLVEELADAHYARADFYQVDLDEQPLIAGDFNIAGVPALVICQEGKEEERIVGLRAYPDLEKVVVKYLIN